MGVRKGVVVTTILKEMTNFLMKRAKSIWVKGVATIVIQKDFAGGSKITLEMTTRTSDVSVTRDRARMDIVKRRVTRG